MKKGQNNNYLKDLKHSLLKPFYNWKALLVMVISSAIIFLPLFWAIGYIAQNLKKNNCNLIKLTKFGNFWRTGFLGLLIFLISVLWYLPLGIILLLIGKHFGSLQYLWINLYLLFPSVDITHWILLFIFALLIAVLSPASILIFINKGSFIQSLNLKEILSFSLSKKYLTRLFVVEIIDTILTLIYLYSSIWIFGSIVGSPLPFYLWLPIGILKMFAVIYTLFAGYTFLGKIYKNSG